MTKRVARVFYVTGDLLVYIHPQGYSVLQVYNKLRMHSGLQAQRLVRMCISDSMEMKDSSAITLVPQPVLVGNKAENYPRS